MNLAIRSAPCPQASARLRSRSRIHVIYADPVVIPVNARARDLIKLFQLLAADLAYLAIRHLDLGIIA